MYNEYNSLTSKHEIALDALTYYQNQSTKFLIRGVIIYAILDYCPHLKYSNPNVPNVVLKKKDFSRFLSLMAYQPS